MVKTVNEFIDLSSKSACNAYDLIRDQHEFLSSLFQSAEELIQLAKTDKSVAVYLTQQQTKKMASLFCNPEEFICLAAIDPDTADILIHDSPSKITPLFKIPDDYFKLACANKSPALALISLTQKDMYVLFEKAKITESLLECAKKCPSLAELFLKFISKENIDQDSLSKFQANLGSYSNQSSAFFNQRNYQPNPVFSFVKKVFGYN